MLIFVFLLFAILSLGKLSLQGSGWEEEDVTVTVELTSIHYICPCTESNPFVTKKTSSHNAATSKSTPTGPKTSSDYWMDWEQSHTYSSLPLKPPSGPSQSKPHAVSSSSSATTPTTEDHPKTSPTHTKATHSSETTTHKPSDWSSTRERSTSTSSSKQWPTESASSTSTESATTTPRPTYTHSHTTTTIIVSSSYLTSTTTTEPTTTTTTEYTTTTESTTTTTESTTTTTTTRDRSLCPAFQIAAAETPSVPDDTTTTTTTTSNPCPAFQIVAGGSTSVPDDTTLGGSPSSGRGYFDNTGGLFTVDDLGQLIFVSPPQVLDRPTVQCPSEIAPSFFLTS